MFVQVSLFDTSENPDIKGEHEMSAHKGSCHCGAVTYEVEGELDGPIACNCSMCGRAGTILVFVPATSFRLVQGEGALTDYQFGKKHIHHLFCATCGIKPYAWGIGEDGSRTYAVNLRCIEGVDPAALEVQAYDGAAI